MSAMRRAERGQLPDDASPELKEAWEILQSSDRSPEALARMQELQRQATGDDEGNIGWLIEGWLVGGGIAAGLKAAQEAEG
ncbi:MAG TPA: hypothetical protein V6D06_14690 [Trichocoleus sp.]